MATVQATIQASYRRSGVLGAGVSMNAAQKDVGKELLLALYKKFFADGLFGRFADVYLTDGTAYTANEDERIVNPSAAVVTKPTSVVDTYSGDQRAVYDGSKIEIVTPGSDPERYLFDGSRGAWLPVHNLGLNDYAPMTDKWEEHLKSMLAWMICDDNGNPISKELAARAGMARVNIAQGFSGPRRPAPAEYF